ncbi:hypothetical protein VTP01DRAFT_10954 [Rhizomucor pusillus]|uniref:uncharacterized protein n=1 Tax=Rhizomucor pusillus TaxID=4840 RepID=UPI003743CC59
MHSKNSERDILQHTQTISLHCIFYVFFFRSSLKSVHTPRWTLESQPTPPDSYYFSAYSLTALHIERALPRIGRYWSFSDKLIALLLKKESEILLDRPVHTL